MVKALVKEQFLLGQPIWSAAAETAADLWDLAIREEEPSDDVNKYLEPALRVPQIANVRTAANWVRLKSREKLLDLVTGVVFDISDRADDVEAADSGHVSERAGQRVGLVCGAGLGKTTNLKWLQAAINRAGNYRGPHFAFFRELNGLPSDQHLLFQEMVTELTGKVGIEYRSTIEFALTRMLKAGRVIFLLDSLDQANPNPKGEDVQALHALCTGIWSSCPIWVSGRPYASSVAREGLESATSPWQFLRIGQLDEPECRQLLETTVRR